MLLAPKRVVLFFTLIILSSSFATDQEPTRQLIKLSLGSSRTVPIPKLSRIAVGNSKIVKAQSLSNSQMLLLGKARGNTTVRAWTQEGKEFGYEVRVVASDLESVSQNTGRDVVKISLEFLELDEAFSETAGFKWPDYLQFAGTAKVLGDAASTGLNYEFNFMTGQAWLHHMVQEGWAKVVARPDLYVRLGEEALFHSGGEFPVATSVENFGQSYRRIEWKGYGLTARVLPQSIDNIHITSDINLEISELIASQNSQGIPSLNRRSLKTKMNSIEGETVVLSGLAKQNSQKEKEGIPLLSSIPILGPLFFTKTADGAERTELLMAVTFSMTTKAQERAVFDEFEVKKEKFKNEK